MIINRDNYETIFLLYVDNELSAEEIVIVKDFAEANPDLADELKILQSAVLPAEDAVFVPKTQLYRNTTHVESVQESLLLMVDNELPDAYRSGLLKQIDESSHVKEEWQLLQSTVLDKNDVVAFPDKKLLYRHNSRVVPMKVWRVAAAVLIGIGLYSGLTLYNNKKVNEKTSVLTKTSEKPAGIGLDMKQKPKTFNMGERLVSQEQTAGPQNKIDLTAKSAAPYRNQSPTKTLESIKKGTDKNVPAQEFPDKLLAKEDYIIEKKPVQPDRTDDVIVVTSSPVKTEVDQSVINDADVGILKNTFTRLAVNEEDPDRFLNIEEDKVTRSKLGGIIRQVKRVVERNTKIKTSNGLRIGGFEIAIK